MDKKVSMMTVFIEILWYYQPHVPTNDQRVQSPTVH